VVLCVGMTADSRIFNSTTLNINGKSGFVLFIEFATCVVDFFTVVL